MKRVMILLIIVGLLLANYVSQSYSPETEYELCQPGVYNVKSRTETITVVNGHLKVRYYFPDEATPGTPTFGFEDGKLPGYLLIHGHNFSGADQAALDPSSEAADLAKTCQVVMTG